MLNQSYRLKMSQCCEHLLQIYNFDCGSLSVNTRTPTWSTVFSCSSCINQQREIFMNSAVIVLLDNLIKLYLFMIINNKNVGGNDSSMPKLPGK